MTRLTALVLAVFAVFDASEAAHSGARFRIKTRFSTRRVDKMADELARDLLITQGEGTNSEKFWPFSSWGTQAAVAPAQKVVTQAVLTKKVEDSKMALFASSVFQQKTSELCVAATENLMTDCKTAASERLFCSMFTRHEESFRGMAGEQEEKEKCRSTDIMETAVDAAKDMAENRLLAEDA